MKSKKTPRKPKDLAVTRAGSRRIKGGAVKKATAPALSPPTPPSGPVDIGAVLASRLNPVVVAARLLR